MNVLFVKCIVVNDFFSCINKVMSIENIVIVCSCLLMIGLVSTELRKEPFETVQEYQDQYQLPQTGFEDGKGWQEISQSMIISPPSPPSLKAPSLNRWYDWQANMQSICSSYDAPIAPRTPQDCPDTSFSYVTDLSKFVKDVPKGQGGCIQLGRDSQNFCYSDKRGKYHVWWEKVATQSP